MVAKPVLDRARQIFERHDQTPRPAKSNHDDKKCIKLLEKLSVNKHQIGGVIAKLDPEPCLDHFASV